MLLKVVYPCSGIKTWGYASIAKYWYYKPVHKNLTILYLVYKLPMMFYTHSEFLVSAIHAACYEQCIVLRQMQQ